MIQSHISSTQGYEVILKLERFSHLSSRSFRLDSIIRCFQDPARPLFISNDI